MKKRLMKPAIILAALSLVLAFTLVGCGSTVSKGDTVGSTSDTEMQTSSASADDAPEIPGLTYDHKMDLQYATCFNVYYYNDGYKLIDVQDDVDQYLIVPEGQPVPDGLADNIEVLQQPLDNIYLCATASMSLFDAIGQTDAVTMTGTDTSGWYIQQPIDALNAGTMKYVGKYSAPDYEALVNSDCDCALESTMILHTPEVQEMLEQLGIPVFIERSSNESNPLGRTEWVKVYGAMLNQEDAADEFFAKETSVMDEMQNYENTGKTVAFFAINSDGSVVVRRPTDYIAQSIDIAGGVYDFSDLEGSGKETTVDMTMEQFYATAVNDDYLIYNGTIEGPLTSVDALLAKSDTFADFKAVKEGHVWTCDKTMYQSTDQIAEMIDDFHIMVTDGDPNQMTFLTKVN